MTERHTADSITSDALDALYESLDAAQDAELYRQLQQADEAFASATVRAAKAESVVDRARAASRRLTAALIAVESLLTTPYPDDPRSTPWSHFVEPALKNLRAALDTPAPTAGQDGLGGVQDGPEGPEAGTEPSEAGSGPQTGTEHLHRLRAQLLAAKARMDAAADQHPRPDLDHLCVTPQNGISAGLATALFYIDHHIREAEAAPAPDTPLHTRLAAAIHDCPAGYPDDIATALLPVIEREIALNAASQARGGHETKESR